MRRNQGVPFYCFIFICLGILEIGIKGNDTIGIVQDSVILLDTIPDMPSSSDRLILTEQETLEIDSIIDSSTSNLVENVYAKISTIDGKEFIFDINEESDSYITFFYPLNRIERYMSTDIIAQITYPDGTLKKLHDPINNDENKPDSTKTWEDIRHTYDKDDVAGLYETGELYSIFESAKLKYKTETLEKSALIVMKRKAVRQNADIVLVEETKVHRGYGELPYVEIWGKGYSYTK